MRARDIILVVSFCVEALCFTAGCSRSSVSATDGGTAGKGGSSPRSDAAVDSADSGRDSGAAGKGGIVCSTNSSHSKAVGEVCGCASDCGSGFCADGVCCATSCTGNCTSCNLPGSEGACLPVPEGIKPRSASECQVEAVSLCGHDGTCDGKGGCRLYVSGTACSPGVCDTDAVTGGKICDGAGACKLGAAEVCWPYGCSAGKCSDTCVSDADCAAGVKCVGNSCGKLPTGRGPCVGDDACLSGHCANGVCCNVACDGACVSCAQTGFSGQCRPVGLGMAHPQCVAQSQASCGITGVCDGFGSCAVYQADTTCLAPSCTGNTANISGTCDGSGTCQPPGQVKCDPYVCANGACVTTCTNDMQCVPPATCVNGSCGKKPTGSSCSTATQCDSNFCVDGVCCESACDGACRSCGMTGSPGRCVDVAAGRDDPHQQCKDLGAASCGTDGKCDGSGACRTYAVGTMCGAQTCLSGSYTPPATCSAAGQCIPPASQTCYPFACNGSRCFDVCTKATGQCVSPNACVNGSCGLKPPGASCSGSTECQAAPDGKQYCSQGVCCNAPCSGACQACNLGGSLGSCTGVSNGTADGRCPTTNVSTCGTSGTCRLGACDVYHTGNQCKAPSCSGTATSLVASFCDGRGSACPGQSAVQCGAFKCNTATGLCGVSCDTDSQCVSPNSCVNHSCGKKANGTICSSNSECQAGNCVEGVCCNTACSSASSGVCQSCKVSNHVGTCTPVPAGGTDPGARCKASSKTSCGLDGTCNGAGSCRNWDTSTSCRDQSCPAGATQTNAATCDGKGACAAATTKNCSPYACNVNASTCGNTCTANADCAAGVSCNTQTNKCGDKLPAGQVCGVDNDCQAGNCVEGVCCNTACSSASSGVCQSCKVSNHVGTCTPVPAGRTDPGGRCKASDKMSCGLDGTCDGAGSCRNWDTSTSCGDQSCPAGATQTNPACDGKGACVAASTNCSPYACNVSASACGNSCMVKADCAAGFSCNTQTSKCVAKLPAGQVCGVDNDCSSVHCAKAQASDATGVCCDTACTNGCKSCALSKKVGTCSNIPPDTAPRDATCPAGSDPCGNTGMCDGNGACQVKIADKGMCSDDDMCTTGDTCQAGVCTGGTATKCAAGDECQPADTCKPKTGCTTPPPVLDGMPCISGVGVCCAGMCTANTTCPVVLR